MNCCKYTIYIALIMTMISGIFYTIDIFDMMSMASRISPIKIQSPNKKQNTEFIPYEKSTTKDDRSPYQENNRTRSTTAAGRTKGRNTTQGKEKNTSTRREGIKGIIKKRPNNRPVQKKYNKLLLQRTTKEDKNKTVTISSKPTPAVSDSTTKKTNKLNTVRSSVTIGDEFDEKRLAGTNPTMTNIGITTKEPKTPGAKQTPTPTSTGQKEKGRVQEVGNGGTRITTSRIMGGQKGQKNRRKDKTNRDKKNKPDIITRIPGIINDQNLPGVGSGTGENIFEKGLNVASGVINLIDDAGNIVHGLPGEIVKSAVKGVIEGVLSDSTNRPKEPGPAFKDEQTIGYSKTFPIKTSKSTTKISTVQEYIIAQKEQGMQTDSTTNEDRVKSNPTQLNRTSDTTVAVEVKPEVPTLSSIATYAKSEETTNPSLFDQGTLKHIKPTIIEEALPTTVANETDNSKQHLKNDLKRLLLSKKDIPYAGGTSTTSVPGKIALKITRVSDLSAHPDVKRAKTDKKPIHMMAKLDRPTVNRDKSVEHQKSSTENPVVPQVSPDPSKPKKSDCHTNSVLSVICIENNEKRNSENLKSELKRSTYGVRQT